MAIPKAKAARCICSRWKKNFYGGHGIVGAQVPLGTGLAFANKYRDADNIALTFFGDGAANQGQVYESFNMAKLWNLPCLYIIENNRYAMGTSIERSSSQTDLSQRGAGFGIPGEQVDGMDVEAVYTAGMKAADYVRRGNGPYILEMLTYRYRGHSMSDPAKYRKREEVDKVREETDPIKVLETHLAERRVMSEATLKKRRNEIREEIEAAVDYALSAPLPADSELMTDILAAPINEGEQPTWPLKFSCLPSLRRWKAAKLLNGWSMKMTRLCRAILLPRLKPIKRLSNWKPLMMAQSAKSFIRQGQRKLTSISRLPLFYWKMKTKAT